MKISLNWLNAYLDPPVTVGRVADLLTGHGFPVEATVTHTDGPAAGDTMLDVEVTSNRGDCLSHFGVAREVAAATGATLRRPELSDSAGTGPPVSDRVSIEVRDAAACPVYSGRVMTGVKVGPSPDWLVSRLAAVGLRSVNNVVDVTNFVLMECGQPLHAFNLARLAGGKVVVRPAAKSEKFQAIDGSKHELSPGMLVIADAEKPQAVAGIMGGLESEVTQATTELFIESAEFDPLSVRRTGRSLKLASDASFRFERGVDPAGIEWASRRAVQLIQEVAGGEVCDGVLRLEREGHAASGQDERPAVALRLARLRSLLGFDLTRQQVLEFLSTRLGFECVDPEREETLEFVIPSYRLDLTREVDLIEEVARLHGMDAIPVRPRLELTVQPPQDVVRARQILAEVLVAHGFHETITFSFISPEIAEPFLPSGGSPLLLEGDHKKDEPMLRPSVIPSLLQCRKLNQDAGNEGVRLFESASTWHLIEGRTVETVKLAVLRDVSAGGEQQPGQEALRHLRGVVDELVERLGGGGAVERLSVEPAEGLPGLGSPHGAGRLMLDGRQVGVMGLVDAAVLEAAGLSSPQAALECGLDALLELYPPRWAVGGVPRFPQIQRDLSLILDEAVRWAEVVAAVRAARPELLERVEFLGIYRGKPIPQGQKSLSLRLGFRDPDRTLTHQQVDPQMEAVTRQLGERVGATLRGQ